MNLKVKYGSVENTKVIDENTTITKAQTFHAGAPVASKTVIRHRHIVQKHDASKVNEIFEKLFCDPTKIDPKVYTEYLKPSGTYYHVIEEYTTLEY